MSAIRTLTNALSDHSVSDIQITPFDVPAETAVSAGLTWDVVGNADYRAIKNVMFVDIDGFTTVEAAPSEEPQFHTFFQLW